MTAGMWAYEITTQHTTRGEPSTLMKAQARTEGFLGARTVYDPATRAWALHTFYDAGEAPIDQRPLPPGMPLPSDARLVWIPAELILALEILAMKRRRTT